MNSDTADAHWWITDEGKVVFFGYNPKVADSYKGTMMEYLPYWTLGALLGVLPNKYVIVKNYHGDYYVESRDHKKSTIIFSNPIDACYEMILKLNELNLL